MKIIVPMAGMGKRMRPHTLTTPKPLLPIAGKPIVQRLVEGIAGVCDEKVDEIAFVIGRFGEKTEKQLLLIAEQIGAKGSIHYQDEALGTAHAILCAKEKLDGPVIVAFADTLFYADFVLDGNKDGIIWVERVEDPRAFGVVKLSDEGTITEFVEKPEEFVSDLAIIGIYYFKDGANLRNELQFLIDNDIRDKGEFQLTNALENMKEKGLKFYPGKVDEWLDCGNKNATVHTNQRVLENTKSAIAEHQSKNVVIIDPCYIGKNAELDNCIIGPHVSIGDNTKMQNVVISNSIIQDNTEIRNQVISNSMIGKHVSITGSVKDLSVGDYNQITD